MTPGSSSRSFAVGQRCVERIRSTFARALPSGGGGGGGPLDATAPVGFWGGALELALTLRAPFDGQRRPHERSAGAARSDAHRIDRATSMVIIDGQVARYNCIAWWYALLA